MIKNEYIAPEIDVIKLDADSLMLVGESKVDYGNGIKVKIVDDNDDKSGKQGGEYDILAKPNHFFEDENIAGWDKFE